MPRLILGIVVSLLLAVVPQSRASDIEPILTETDAVAGLPLVMPVRVGNTGQPRSSVTLRFPDGREVRGDVAAVRFRARARRGTWLPPGPEWEVLTASQIPRDRSGLAWFVIADLPRGVVGQEIWLDGKPVTIRWLPRPAILGARYGFDPETPAGPIVDPWASPIPDDWRGRPDLAAALNAIEEDPLRAWRARLGLDGLHTDGDQAGAGAVAITPDLLDPEIIGAATAAESIADRLTRTVRALAAARWRLGLARLWAADPALSLRVRHALAGAGSFRTAAGDRVVAPVWTADDAEASALLSILLAEETTTGGRAQQASEWLGGLPTSGLWVIDDGVDAEKSQRPATIGAMLFAAGDGSAIPMGGSVVSDRVARPVPLRARESVGLTAPIRAHDDGRAVYRILGENRGVRVDGSVLALVPPGIATGPLRGDLGMGSVVGTAPPDRGTIGRTPSALISAGDARVSGRVSPRVVVRLPGVVIDGEPVDADAWRVRLWIGPFERSRAVVLITGSGRAEVQELPGAGGREFPLPIVRVGVDGLDVLVEIDLPAEAAESDGLVQLGIEVVDPGGVRTAWPRGMLPWTIEPARRAIDPSAWLGDLGG